MQFPRDVKCSPMDVKFTWTLNVELDVKCSPRHLQVVPWTLNVVPWTLNVVPWTLSARPLDVKFILYFDERGVPPCYQCNSSSCWLHEGSPSMPSFAVIVSQEVGF
jgi:hypothetical protein